jgi:hypothetical protein
VSQHHSTCDSDIHRLAHRDAPHKRYDYAAPAFGFGCQLVYDESGLVLRYPGLAVRVA